jgi:hypothetical protein
MLRWLLPPVVAKGGGAKSVNLRLLSTIFAGHDVRKVTQT